MYFFLWQQKQTILHRHLNLESSIARVVGEKKQHISMTLLMTSNSIGDNFVCFTSRKNSSFLQLNITFHLSRPYIDFDSGQQSNISWNCFLIRFTRFTVHYSIILIIFWNDSMSPGWGVWWGHSHPLFMKHRSAPYRAITEWRLAPLLMANQRLCSEV